MKSVFLKKQLGHRHLDWREVKIGLCNDNTSVVEVDLKISNTIIIISFSTYQIFEYTLFICETEQREQDTEWEPRTTYIANFPAKYVIPNLFLNIPTDQVSLKKKCCL